MNRKVSISEKVTISDNGKVAKAALPKWFVSKRNGGNEHVPISDLEVC